MTIIKNTVKKIIREPYQEFGIWWVDLETDVYRKITIMNCGNFSIGSVFYQSFS